jgi:hypothetical protein
VAVVIVTWNSEETIGHVLTGLEGYEVVVVDNASSDATCDMVREFAHVKLIASTENRGFGWGCNCGAEATSAERLLFLNPDTTPRREEISRLIALVDDPGIGIAVPALSHSATQVAATIGHFPSPMFDVIQSMGLWRCRKRSWLNRRTRLRIDWGFGACLAMRRETFDRVGGFNPLIFLYGEDMDLCFRIRRLGLEIVMDLSIVIPHIGNSAGEQTFSAEARARRVLAGEYEFLCRYRGKRRADAALEFKRMLSRIHLGVSPERRVLQDVLESRSWRVAQEATAPLRHEV